MEDEFFNSVKWKRICSWIRKSCPVENDAEDICQYVAEQLLKDRKGQIKNIVIDYYRKHYGRLDRDSEFENNKAQVMLGSYSEVVDFDSFCGESYDMDMPIDFEILLRVLSEDEQQKLIFRLMGLSLDEIGERFNLCRSAVCLQLQRIMKKIEKRRLLE